MNLHNEMATCKSTINSSGLGPKASGKIEIHRTVTFSENIQSDCKLGHYHVLYPEFLSVLITGSCVALAIAILKESFLHKHSYTIICNQYPLRYDNMSSNKVSAASHMPDKELDLLRIIDVSLAFLAPKSYKIRK